ncbi:MAG: zf-HC2 domain-containing protein [Kofleriaceae bacterium]
MLSCKQITELVTEYLEGRMGLADRMRFQLHIGMCKHCRAYLRQMKTTIAVLGRLPDESMPDHVRDELRKRFADWNKTRSAAGKKQPEPA